jgi:glycosyltransferase involved in cell wall biosynthesis
MKIILTCHQFFPEYSAGTEVLVHSVAKELQKNSHHVIVFCASPTKKDMADTCRFDTYRFDGINVIRFWHSVTAMGNQTNVMSLEYDNQFVAGYFRDILISELPDIVHFFHFGRITSSLIPECIIKNIPCFFTPTDFWVTCPLNQLLLPNGALCVGPQLNATNCIKHLATIKLPFLNGFLNKIPNVMFKYTIQWFSYFLGKNNQLVQMIIAATKRPEIINSRINRLNAIFVPNHFMANILAKNNISKKLMHYSPYGINSNSDKPLNTPNPENYLRIGFIGTISPNKGLHVILKAIHLLPTLKVKIKIYGDLTLYPDYVSKIIPLIENDSRITLCGTFDNTDIHNIFAGIDVLVVPSIWYENTPLVIYSAQSCGCPVIASDIGSIPEVIIHGKNGLLFPPGQVDKLAKAITHINEDRRLLKKLADNAIHPRSITNYVDELLKHYQLTQIKKSPKNLIKRKNN